MPIFGYRFDEMKATQAAALFLELAGGRENYTKLIKLLYLLDREALIRQGHPVTGDRLVSMPLGPVVSNVYDLVSTAPDPDEPCAWHRHVARDGYDVCLAADPGRGGLNGLETGLIESLSGEHADRDWRAMVRYCHDPRNVSEWRDPMGISSDIWPEDILRHGGWTEEDIAEDARELAHFERMRESLA